MSESTGPIHAMRDAADLISLFHDALIEFELSDIQRLTVAAAPVIVAHVLRERETQDAR
jgi:hypothetical protein